MKRRAFLTGVSASALLAAGCGAGGGKAVVKIATKSSGPAEAPVATTPTPVPPPELISSADTVFQGGAVLISLVGQVKDGSVTFLERTRPLGQGSQSIYSFVGIEAEAPPGAHPMKIDFTLASGSKGSLMSQAVVAKTNWTIDSIIISDKLAALLDPKLGADELTALTRVYSGMTYEKLWSGAWAQPVPGAITTRFGEKRSYNGAPASGHHSGTDIGAGAGAPVGATNSGRVVMARQLALRGNMVVVDHGGGLFSGYSHLQSFAVGEGQAVAAGELLGFVGTTGLSTGPHLHWEMASGGVVVDAFRFMDGTNGF